MKENPLSSLPGIPFLLAMLLLAAAGIWLLITGIGPDSNAAGPASTGSLFSGIGMAVLAGFSLTGLYMVQPNQAAVLSLFGKYVGTVK
ncbi:MAG: hypothetical protein RLY77_873, partial [Pseudomonadota bacterium]